MPDYTFHIGVNVRQYTDHVIAADTLECARKQLTQDMVENSCLHVFDVTVDGVTTELEEDIELPDEQFLRRFNQRSVAVPLIAHLQNALPFLNSVADAVPDPEPVAALIRGIETTLQQTEKNIAS